MSNLNFRSDPVKTALMAMTQTASAAVPAAHVIGFGSAPTTAGIVAATGTAAGTTTLAAAAVAAAPFVIGAAAVGGLIYLVSRK